MGVLEVKEEDILEDGIRFRYRLVAAPSANQPFAGPSTKRQHLRLFNNAELEVAAICRNPRNAPQWWRPDGRRFDRAPVEILKLPELAPTRRSTITIVPENEFLFYVRWTLPPGVRIHSFQPQFDPRPSDWETPATILDLARNQEADAHLACFDNVPEKVTYRVAVSFGPWDAVSTYNLDSKTAQDVKSGTMALWSEPRYDEEAKALRYEIMHNVDRRTYALRLRARYRNGTMDELVFHSGPQSGSPTKGFALMHGSEPETMARLANILELILERTPWVRCEIPEIVLQPSSEVAPLEDAEGQR
jgi:hypothetical protein